MADPALQDFRLPLGGFRAVASRRPSGGEPVEVRREARELGSAQGDFFAKPIPPFAALTDSLAQVGGLFAEHFDFLLQAPTGALQPVGGFAAGRHLLLGRSDEQFLIGRLPPQFPQFALARKQPGFAVVRAHRDRAVSLQSFPGGRDKPLAGKPPGQIARHGQTRHEPGTAEKLIRQPAKFRIFARHEPVGPHDFGGAGQCAVGRRRRRRSNRQERDPAAERFSSDLQGEQQPVGVAHDKAFSPPAQRDIEQMSDIAGGTETVADEADHAVAQVRLG